MDEDVMDGQIGVYFRRRALGLRLLSHGARPQTVERWCGLTRYQLKTMRERWSISGEDAKRGASPSSFDVFFESKTAACQAALFVSLCQVLGVISARRGPKARADIASLNSAKLFCEALEMLKAWEPEANLDFEYAELLVNGAVEETLIALIRCERCAADALEDKLERQKMPCTFCRAAA